MTHKDSVGNPILSVPRGIGVPSLSCLHHQAISTGMFSPAFGGVRQEVGEEAMAVDMWRGR